VDAVGYSTTGLEFSKHADSTNSRAADHITIAHLTPGIVGLAVSMLAQLAGRVDGFTKLADDLLNRLQWRLGYLRFAHACQRALLGQRQFRRRSLLWRITRSPHSRAASARAAVKVRQALRERGIQSSFMVRYAICGA
jgi:hypothetical protein